MHMAEEQLFSLAENSTLLSTTEQDHLADCPTCREALSAYRELAEGFARRDVWGAEIQAEPCQPLTDRTLLFLRQIESEEQAASPLIRKLEQSPELTFSGCLAGVAPTAGLARALTGASAATREKSPSRALALAVLACAVSRTLPPSRYPGVAISTLKALAEKERANALRYLGRLDEALSALDDSERFLRGLLSADFDLACLDYIRATIYSAQGHHEAATDLLEGSTNIFREFGEINRVAHATFLRALLFVEEGRVHEAKDLLLDLSAAHGSCLDLETRAGLANNLAECSSRLQEFSDAAAHLLEALSLYQELDLPVKVARLRWGLGFLQLQAGKIAEAAVKLREARADLCRHGLSTEAAVAGLDLISALLALNERGEILAICREIRETFTKSGMSKEAERAASYLAEAEARGRLTPPMVSHVKTFLSRLPDEPAILFAPLPEAP